MKIVKADHAGMCFGVRDALALAERQPLPTEITILGELVHNHIVNEKLAERGFQRQREDERGVPTTTHVLITAHGISDRARAELLAPGKTLVDTTCPLVHKAHAAALHLAEEGRHVVIVGQAEHVEVRGLTGDLPSYTVVQGVAEVRNYGFTRLGMMAQTTTPTLEFGRVIDAVKRANAGADVRVMDTICQPTKDRQRALQEMLEAVTVVVVIGGRNSNNTLRLLASCRAHGVRSVHIEDAGELVADWFGADDVVGVTAGTSTLGETVENVVRRLWKMSQAGRVRAGVR